MYGFGDWLSLWNIFETKWYVVLVYHIILYLLWSPKLNIWGRDWFYKGGEIIIKRGKGILFFSSVFLPLSFSLGFTLSRPLSLYFLTLSLSQYLSFNLFLFILFLNLFSVFITRGKGFCFLLCLSPSFFLSRLYSFSPLLSLLLTLSLSHYLSFYLFPSESVFLFSLLYSPLSISFFLLLPFILTLSLLQSLSNSFSLYVFLFFCQYILSLSISFIPLSLPLSFTLFLSDSLSLYFISMGVVLIKLESKRDRSHGLIHFYSFASRSN